MEQHVFDMVHDDAVCTNGHRFTFHRFPDMSYGLLELSTPDPHDFAYINAATDPVFAEVSRLVHDMLDNGGKKPLDIAHCIHNVLPLACDLAPSGQRYMITTTHWCPICRSTRIKIGEEIPTIFDQVDMAHVTHQQWQRLNEAEKRDLVLGGLRNAGCI